MRENRSLRFSEWLAESPWGLTKAAVRIRLSVTMVVTATFLLNNHVSLQPLEAFALNTSLVALALILVMLLPWLASRRAKRRVVQRYEENRVLFGCLASMILGIVANAVWRVDVGDWWLVGSLAVELILLVWLPGVRGHESNS